LAIKYLAGERLIGTAAERAALTTGGADIDLTFSGATEGGQTWTNMNQNGRTISGGLFTMNSSTSGVSTWEISPTVAVTDSMTVDYDLMRLSSDHFDHPMISIRSDAVGHGDPSGDNVRATISFWSNGNTGTTDSNASWNGGVGRYGASPVEHNVAFLSGSVQSYIGQTRDIRFYARWILSATTTRKITSQIWTGSGAEAARDAGNTGHASNILNSEGSAAAIGSAFSGGSTLPYKYLILEGNTSAGHWSMEGIKVKFNATTIPALVYPNLPNGTIFEESDTGKHYMFDGTSTWNEMT